MAKRKRTAAVVALGRALLGAVASLRLVNDRMESRLRGGKVYLVASEAACGMLAIVAYLQSWLSRETPIKDGLPEANQATVL